MEILASLAAFKHSLVVTKGRQFHDPTYFPFTDRRRCLTRANGYWVSGHDFFAFENAEHVSLGVNFYIYGRRRRLDYRVRLFPGTRIFLCFRFFRHLVRHSRLNVAAWLQLSLLKQCRM